MELKWDESHGYSYLTPSESTTAHFMTTFCPPSDYFFTPFQQYCFIFVTPKKRLKNRVNGEDDNHR